jgi:hypothetical protein
MTATDESRFASLFNGVTSTGNAELYRLAGDFRGVREALTEAYQEELYQRLRRSAGSPADSRRVAAGRFRGPRRRS